MNDDQPRSKPAESAGQASAPDGSSGTEFNARWQSSINAHIDDERNNLQTAPGKSAPGRPPGPTIVGVVALVLLAAGGYGLIQQRSAAREEIRHLQAVLASRASPAEVAATREELQDIEQKTAEKKATIEILNLYKKRMMEIVAGLEIQLAAKKAVAPMVGEAGHVATRENTARPAATERISDKVSAVAGGGNWFVNFGSYTRRSAAENWASKLSPEVGKAVVVAGTKDDKALYRVRIVGLTNRAQADKVAAQLQSAHNLRPLWVGKD